MGGYLRGGRERLPPRIQQGSYKLVLEVGEEKADIFLRGKSQGRRDLLKK